MSEPQVGFVTQASAGRAAEAADLKVELDDSDLPGYKAFGYGGFDLGYAGGGSGSGHGSHR